MTILKVDQGLLKGVIVTTTRGKRQFRFLGVPYAEPPIGALRFKPPVPIKQWSGTRDATKDPNICSQIRVLSTQYAGKEDCLYLNIYTKNLFTSLIKPKPVIVYIHGGGFNNGSGNSNVFSPDYLIDHEIVLVTINYRLGPLGFLCLDIPEAPGNMGLRDQSLALKWINQNIKHFGGDENNITVMGFSVGGACVEYHMISPMSRGLFHKAILQSGSLFCPWAYMDNPIEHAQQLVKELGSDAVDSKDMLEFLATVDVEKLTRAAFNLKIKDDIILGKFFPFVPVIEKTFENVEAFLAEEPIQLIKAGKMMNIPTISGFSEMEGIIFKYFYGPDDIQNLRFNRFINFIPENYKGDVELTDETLRHIYKQQFEDKNPEDSMNNFLSDSLIVGPVHRSLKLRMGNQNHFLYRFSYDGNLNVFKIALNINEKGACHCDESAYLAAMPFKKEPHFTPKDLAVRRRLTKMWTDFAKFSNPTPEKTELIKVMWRPVTAEKLYTLDIGEELIMRSDFWRERMSLWEDFYKRMERCKM